MIGYGDLQSVRKSLNPVMIRRKKDEVLRQLPERIDKTFFVPMTKEQRVIHDENLDIVSRLAAKWRRYKFLCEADQRRLRIALNYMRMAADNTFLVDKKTVHGPKIDELDILLKEIVLEGKEKVVIFSQWIRMMELVERVLQSNGIGYAFLNGQIPSRERKGLTSRFREDPSCMVFLSTDAGGVGLNLQSGSVVINMDMPWNPAVLEQRIGRVHRLGQRKAVRVVNFVTESSIEERILDLLRFKRSLFAGVLDREGEDVVMLGGSLMKRFMQSVETITADLDKADPAREKTEPLEPSPAAQENGCGPKTSIDGDEDRIASAGDGNGNGRDMLGDLVVAGARFLMDLGRTLALPAQPGEKPFERLLESMVDRDEKTGRICLKIPLPEKEVVTNLFSALGEIVASAAGAKGAGPR